MCSVVREACSDEWEHLNATYNIQHTTELCLNCLRQIGILYIAVNWCLICENHVKVGDILKKTTSTKMRATRRANRTTGLATLGLKGGWIFFAARSLKSMCLWKKGWRLISSAPFAPSRRLGSRFRRAVRMVQASEPNSSPNRSGSFNIFRYILSVSSLRHSLNENSMLSLFNQRTIVERWEPGKHLIQQHSQSPPINRLVCGSIFLKANTRNVKQVLTYHIHFHKESRVPNTPEFHRKCWFYHCPSCSIYTSQSRTAQYGQCNQARCFQASSPWRKV